MKSMNNLIRHSVIICILFQTGSLLAGNTRNTYTTADASVSNAPGNIATTWSESKNVKWKTAIHGKGWSTPIILGDQIWLTTATEDGKKMYAVCVSKESGKILHDILLLEIEKAKWKNEMNTYATPSPVAADGYVYAEFGPYGTICIEAKTGRIIWKRTDVSPENIPHGSSSSPVIYKNLIILQHDAGVSHKITALDRMTGATVWQVNRPPEFYKDLREDWRKAHSTPIIITVNRKDQLVSESSQLCQVFEPETGKEIWRVTYSGGDGTVSSPLFWNGIAFINTGLSKKELWAVRPDGNGDVTASNVIWKFNENVPGISTPVISKGLIFMINDKGNLSCLDAKTGKFIWKEKLEGSYSFNFAPVSIEGNIYFTDMDGVTTVIKADKKFQVVAENKLEGKFIARPVAAENSLIMRSDTHLYRIENSK
jgi:outer membrane protein assembly factor BamB